MRITHKIKTRPAPWPGELFIGANGWFALMNSAPAELLQLLTFAALQPRRRRPRNGRRTKILLRRWRVAGVCSAPVFPIAATSRFCFLKKKPPGLVIPRQGGHRKNGVVLCILVRVSNPILLIVLRARAAEKTAQKKSRKFNLVNYTKTLSVRNRHNSLSHSFLHDRRAIAH